MRRALVLAVVLLAGCGGSDDAAPPPPTTALRPAPEISGTTLDGRRLALSEYRGRAVVVNVWSSW